MIADISAATLAAYATEALPIIEREDPALARRIRHALEEYNLSRNPGRRGRELDPDLVRVERGEE